MPPYIVGLGGTSRAGSTTEKALRLSLDAAQAMGARTLMFGGLDLMLPLYSTETQERTPEAKRLVEELRAADGIIVASPGYHGTISGMVKNALDYTEDMRADQRPYFDGRAVGCIAVAYGWQAAVSTVTALRSVTHALRGWPTPLGVCLNSTVRLFDDQGNCLDPQAKLQLEIMGRQVMEFALRFASLQKV